MDEDEIAVARPLHIDLDPIDAQFKCFLNRFSTVPWIEVAGSAVTYHLRESK
jgi:hypothetical protein